MSAFSSSFERFFVMRGARLRDMAWLACFCLVLYGLTLGGRVYSAPSEARYIEIGREMAESGDLVTPRLNYVTYFEKPPLFYWVQAGVTRLAGVGPFISRLPTMIFAVVLCLITYLLGCLQYGRRAGLLAGFGIATCLYLFALSRVVLLDVPTGVFLSATLLAFFHAVHTAPGRGRTWVIYGMYALAACSVLAKGLIGVVLPGLVVLAWLVCTGRWRLLREMKLLPGILMFLLLAAPWHVMVALRHPEFLHFYFIHEHLERYTSKVHGRYQPLWFFAGILVAGLFPWLAFFPQSLTWGMKGAWRARKDDGRALFLALWAGIIFVFFSLSDSKLPAYIVPMFPPLFVFLGGYLAAVWNKEKASYFGVGVAAAIVLLVGLAVMPAALEMTQDPAGKVMSALQEAGAYAQYFALASFVAAGIVLLVFIQAEARQVIVALGAVTSLLFLAADLVAVNYRKNSMEHFAQIIQQLHVPGDEVATYRNYYQDLPIYLARRITVVNWRGELEFGATHEDTSAWMTDDAGFWPRWKKGDRRIFAVMRDEQLASLTEHASATSLHLYPIRQEGHNVLLVNQPLETLEPSRQTAPATPHKGPIP